MSYVRIAPEAFYERALTVTFAGIEADSWDAAAEAGEWWAGEFEWLDELPPEAPRSGRFDIIPDVNVEPLDGGEWLVTAQALYAGLDDLPAFYVPEADLPPKARTLLRRYRTPLLTPLRARFGGRVHVEISPRHRTEPVSEADVERGLRALVAAGGAVPLALSVEGLDGRLPPGVDANAVLDGLGDACPGAILTLLESSAGRLVRTAAAGAIRRLLAHKDAAVRSRALRLAAGLEPAPTGGL